MRNPFRRANLATEGVAMYSEEGSPPEMREIAKTDTSDYLNFDRIVQTKGYRIYREMKYDDQVKFCLFYKKLLILSAGWKIIPYDESEAALNVKTFVEDVISSMSKSFFSILYQFLSAFDFGFSVGELIWDRTKDGKYVIRNIKVKPPWEIEFEFDEYGNLSQLWINNEKMPIPKFVIYSFMEQFGNIRGEADLKAAYSGWWLKQNIWKFWKRHFERFGSPIVKGHVPPGATKEEQDKFFSLINRIHHLTGIMLPRNRTGEEFDFEIVETKREGSSAFVEAMTVADEKIARALLIPRLFGGTKESFGSYALGREQFDIVYKSLNYIGNAFAEEVINRQVFKPLVDYNFAPAQRFYPRMVFNEITRETAEGMLR